MIQALIIVPETEYWQPSETGLEYKGKKWKKSMVDKTLKKLVDKKAVYPDYANEDNHILVGTKIHGGKKLINYVSDGTYQELLDLISDESLTWDVQACIEDGVHKKGYEENKINQYLDSDFGNEIWKFQGLEDYLKDSEMPPEEAKTKAVLTAKELTQ